MLLEDYTLVFLNACTVNVNFKMRNEGQKLHFLVEFVKNQRFDVFRTPEAHILFEAVFGIIKHDEDMRAIRRDHEQIACFLIV